MVIFEEKTNLNISRLRTSSHHFAIETGRWHKAISIPYNDRMFKFIALMTCENKTVIQKLSNFVYKAFLRK